MKYNINLYYICKFIFSSKFRVLAIEKNRLKNSTRYIKGTSSLLKTPLEYVDDNTCYYGYLDIFEKEPYKFVADNNTPYIIDCGANIGLSVLYFGRFYPDATIVAFEPDPDIFSVLKKNIENFKLKDASLHEAAVWINNGSLDFQIEGGMSAEYPRLKIRSI